MEKLQRIWTVTWINKLHSVETCRNVNLFTSTGTTITRYHQRWSLCFCWRAKGDEGKTSEPSDRGSSGLGPGLVPVLLGYYWAD